jgi:hypothetical protein
MPVVNIKQLISSLSVNRKEVHCLSASWGLLRKRFLSSLTMVNFLLTSLYDSQSLMLLRGRKIFLKPSIDQSLPLLVISPSYHRFLIPQLAFTYGIWKETSQILKPIFLSFFLSFFLVHDTRQLLGSEQDISASSGYYKTTESLQAM